MDNALVFPSLLAGVLWAVAMLAWFLANDIVKNNFKFILTFFLFKILN